MIKQSGPADVSARMEQIKLAQDRATAALSEAQNLEVSWALGNTVCFKFGMCIFSPLAA